jgi:hypothetical protein
MAGLVPAISIRRGAPLHAIGITGTRPVMTASDMSILGADPGSAAPSGMTREVSRGITSRVLVSAAFSPYVLFFRI